MAAEIGLTARLTNQSALSLLGFDYGPMGNFHFERRILVAAIEEHPKFFMGNGHVIEALSKIFGGKKDGDGGAETLDDMDDARARAKELLRDRGIAYG